MFTREINRIKKTMQEGYITREQILLELFERDHEYTKEKCLDLQKLNFSKYPGTVYINNMRVEKELRQDNQTEECKLVIDGVDGTITIAISTQKHNK